jgi:cell division protein YceG involved in septum cleavage
VARKRQRAGGGARARTQRARSSSRSITRALIFALAVVIALALGALGWLTIVYPMGSGPGRGRELRVDIEPGMDVDALARLLAERGAIRRPRLFAIYARILGADDRLREGTVLLTT